ncbi:DUF932 domain-containing protein [Solidesulfovibrio sp. C21]|uniref:DUF932 domain-containing protein n=1 Tax=Solidesulfovibrio sp. C21 TaxID=3398613 RepID=UPI0039FBB9E9
MSGNLTSFGQVMARVERMSKDCHDRIVPVKAIAFHDLDTVAVHGEVHGLRPTAQRALSCRLGVPLQYVKKCPPDLQAQNLNHWLSKERNDELFLRFDGDDVRAVFTPRYVPVDNLTVLNKLEMLGYSMDSEVQCHLDREFMSLSILDAAGEFTVKGNDRMRPGISIGNSEVGLSALSISAFILRLVCTNGLISKTEVEASYRHVSTRILNDFPTTIGDVSARMIEDKKRLGFSLASEVKDPAATLRSLSRQFLLGKPEVEAVEWAWPQEQGGTMFHVINAYTKAAQYPGLPAESAYRLQRVGGMVLGMVN